MQSKTIEVHTQYLFSIGYRYIVKPTYITELDKNLLTKDSLTYLGKTKRNYEVDLIASQKKWDSILKKSDIKIKWNSNLQKQKVKKR